METDKKLNITENHLMVLMLFTNGYSKEYYIREVYNNLNIGVRTAKRILDGLERKGILTSNIKGNIRVFRTQKNQIARDYFTLTEQYKKILFLQKNSLIAQIVEKITPFIDGIGILFGSYVKGNADEESDLDICIVGECNRSELQKISKIYNISINIFHYSYKLFDKDIFKDHLLKEVIQNHIIITQPDQFIMRIL